MMGFPGSKQINRIEDQEDAFIMIRLTSDLSSVETRTFTSFYNQ